MALQATQFLLSEPPPGQSRITIVGGGIVGSALASYLSTRLPSSQIILLDASPSKSAGSTAIAPGLIGQLNTISHLTTAAKESVAAYSKIPRAFQKVGGLEIASTREGIERLHSRREMARACGLEAEILTSKEVSLVAPDFHAEDENSTGLLFRMDGTADPPLIAKHYQEQAKARGVLIIAAKVFNVVIGEERKISLTSSRGLLETDKLIIAAGIWTPSLLNTLGIDFPIIPVAHPYAHGPSRPRRENQQPFVRWPERHVYARDHGGFDGFGSYDHQPIACVPGDSALFEQGSHPVILESALSVFPSATQLASKTPFEAFSGIFALTADSLPMAGAVPQVPGLYVAAAVWITHAAGVARLVADIVAGRKLGSEDEVLSRAFDPTRFAGEEKGALRERALGTYNDIYNRGKH